MIILRQNNYGLVNKILRNKKAGEIREMKRGLEKAERNKLQDLVNNERKILGSGCLSEKDKNEELLGIMNAKKLVNTNARVDRERLAKIAEKARKELKK